MRADMMVDVLADTAIDVVSGSDVVVLPDVLTNVCTVTMTALVSVPVLSLSEKAFGIDWDT